jgi:transcriptional antiterminator NusG
MSDADFSERTRAADPDADEARPVEDEADVTDRPTVLESPSEPAPEAVTEEDEAAEIEARAESGDEGASIALEEAGGAEPEPASDQPLAEELQDLESEAAPIPEASATSQPAEEPEELAAPAEEPEELAAAVEPQRGPEEDGELVSQSPFDGPGDWYVIHTYAGYENKVKANLQSRIGSMQMEDKIFDVVIPMEDVMEIKGGKKQVVQKKVFPGYLMVKMVYDNDSWYVVRNTPGVTGFVSSGTGTKPTPLSRREVEKILAVKQETQVKPQYRLEWEEGDVVRIIAGPFADFTGTIAEINVEQSKLKVMVNIFDRETPVELAFDQVAKA